LQIFLGELHKITQIQIGAVPTRTGAGADTATIHIFGKDVLKNSTSRFQCLYEGLQQPESGTVMVSMNGTITNHIVLRGMYQTVPITVYGFRLGALADLHEESHNTKVVKSNGLKESQFYWPEKLKLVNRNLFVGYTVFEKVFEALAVNESSRVVEELCSSDLCTMVEKVFESGLVDSFDDNENSDSINLSVAKVVLNKAVEWISSFLAVFSLGDVCPEGLVALGGKGLDLLAISVQITEIANDFLLGGGCALLRCILGVRGLPGSFYNKAIAVTCELLRQTGKVSAGEILRYEFKHCNLGKRAAPFLPVQEEDAEAARGRRQLCSAGKRSSSPGMSGQNDGEERKHSADMEKELQAIKDGEYESLVCDLWRKELRSSSRLSLADAISGHGNRFMPQETARCVEYFIPKALEFYKQAKETALLLKDLHVSLESSSPKTLVVIAGASDALLELASLISTTQTCNLLSKAEGVKDDIDVRNHVLVQIFSSMMNEFKIVQQLGVVLDTLQSSIPTENPSQLVGIFSKMYVEFVSTLMEFPEVLACIRLDPLRHSLTSALLGSDKNPYRVAYKGLAAHFSSYLESASFLNTLLETDWATMKAFMPVKLNLTFENLSFRSTGRQLLERCEVTLTQYLQYKSRSMEVFEDLRGLEASFGATLTFIQELLMSDDPRLLAWWIPSSVRLYETLSGILTHETTMVPKESVGDAQKILGGLFVCSKLESCGLVEVVNVLSSQLPWYRIEDNKNNIMDTSEYFEVLAAANLGKQVAVKMSWDEIRLLLDDSEMLGQVVTSVNIIRSYLKHSDDAPSYCQILGSNNLMIRALMFATEVLLASQSDEIWLYRVGTSMDLCTIERNKYMAIKLFESVSECAYFYLKGVSRITFVESLPMLETLIKAHSTIAIQTQAMMDAGLKKNHIDSSTSSMRASRWNLTRSLRLWVSSLGLKPGVIPTALAGTVAAPSKSGCTVSFAPVEMYSLSLLLGDLFPCEWPMTGNNNHLSPEDKKYRAALTMELESCVVPLEYLISCCASSDLSYVRAATVRLMTKGAGLGGGMGSFLMGIISTQFSEALLPMTCVQVGMYDARKVLEILLPLLYQPALKAATLDSAIPLTLAKLVESTIQQSINFSVAFDNKESKSLLSMAFECIIVLADPSISLDIFGSESSADSLDVLREDTGAEICSLILEHVGIIGENIPLALHLLGLMATTRRGREGILHGAVKLCTKSSQGIAVDIASTDQVVPAIHWLVQQYQNVRSQSDEESIQYIFGSLETILKQACVKGLFSDLDLPSLDSKSAPARFASVAKEAGVRGSRHFLPDFPCNGGYYQLLQDCQELEIFWRNQTLRAIVESSTLTNAAKLSKYVTWDIGSELGKFCIAGIIHPWLTHPRRPLGETMRAEPDYSEEAFDLGDEDKEEQLPMEQRVEPSERKNDPPTGTLKDAEVKNSALETTEASQVNVDLGKLPDLFRQQKAPEGSEGSEGSEGKKKQEDDADDEDFDLYADLYPATANQGDE
jgi:hypothetical protein